MNQDTNQPSSTSPVDELFARRLGQHTVAPDKAGWKRLQTRLTAGPQPARVIAFWQAPAVYRYAAAACLAALLLSGGWLWLRPANERVVAENQPVNHPEKRNQPATTMPNATRQPEPLIAQQNGGMNPPKPARQLLADAKSRKTRPVRDITSASLQAPVQLSRIDTKPAATPAVALTGRVLVVTIPEPDALIEARQAANWSDLPEKTLVVNVEPKPATRRKLLQQLRRASDSIDLASNDEQGLVNKAYLLIKNKLNKKTIKQ